MLTPEGIEKLIKCKPDAIVKDCFTMTEIGVNWMVKEKRIKDTVALIDRHNQRYNDHAGTKVA